MIKLLILISLKGGQYWPASGFALPRYAFLFFALLLAALVFPPSSALTEGARG